VQIIFAGKSHPADDVGKHHLQRVFKRALDPTFGGRVAFVDDYDLQRRPLPGAGMRRVAQHAAQAARGQRPSGMKAAINGVPHLSIGDGWWAEGFNGVNGWVIDGGVADNEDGAGCC